MDDPRSDKCECNQILLYCSLSGLGIITVLLFCQCYYVVSLKDRLRRNVENVRFITKETTHPTSPIPENCVRESESYYERVSFQEPKRSIITNRRPFRNDHLVYESYDEDHSDYAKFVPKHKSRSRIFSTHESHSNSDANMSGSRFLDKRGEKVKSTSALYKDFHFSNAGSPTFVSTTVLPPHMIHNLMTDPYQARTAGISPVLPPKPERLRLISERSNSSDIL